MSSHPEQASRTEVIAAEPAEALAAMLDLDLPFRAGDPIPPLWHWVYLLDRLPQRDLGPDGHPTSGIPAPPGPGRRRMFAGGRVSTDRVLVIGAPATRTSSVASTVDKQGRTGPLTFVTVRHEISQAGEVVIREEQDIVYRAPGTDPLPAPEPFPALEPFPAPEHTAEEPPAPPTGPTLALDVDERLLFRFSALTYNAHRIHYDHGWVRQEGYAGLVVHGPLQALMMGEHQRRRGIDLVGKRFGYRLVAPMIGPQRLIVEARPDGLEHGARVRSAAGTVCATSTLS